MAPPPAINRALVCPTGSWGGVGGGSGGSTRIITVTFARGGVPLSQLSATQIAEFERSALLEVVARMSDGTSAADVLRTWATDSPPTFYAEFNAVRVTQAEADLVVASVRLNGFAVRVSGTTSTDFQTTSASAFVSGSGANSSGDDSGSSGTGTIVLVVLAVLLVLLVAAVAVRWQLAKRRLAETASAMGTAAAARPTGGVTHLTVSNEAASFPGGASISGGGDDENDVSASEYLEVATVNEADAPSERTQIASHIDV